jgi:hypothetical protein
MCAEFAKRDESVRTVEYERDAGGSPGRVLFVVNFDLSRTDDELRE